MNLWLRVAWQPPHWFPVLSLPAPLGHCVNLFQFYLPKRQRDVTSLLKTPYSHSFANENGSGLLILPFVTLNYMAPVWHSMYTSSSAFYVPTKWCCSEHVSPFPSFSLISDCPYLLVFQDPSSVAPPLKDILILNWKGSLVPLNLMVLASPQWPLIGNICIWFFFSADSKLVEGKDYSQRIARCLAAWRTCQMCREASAICIFEAFSILKMEEMPGLQNCGVFKMLHW